MGVKIWFESFCSYLKRLFLDLIFPSFCLKCGMEGMYLCTQCAAEEKRIESPRCPMCYRKGSYLVCNGCRNSIGLDGLIYRFDYEKATLIKKALHELKYNFIEELAAPLGDLLERTLKENLPDEKENRWVICPVPLHNKRLKWRGFNQAELLAKRLSGFGNVCNLLVRSRFSRPQMELDRADRLKNVSGSFLYCADFVPERVVLIDDVATTLSTLNECAGVLKKAGVKEVIGLVLARAV